MIFLIEQALRSTITGINFVERYGGIVRPVSQVREGEEGRTFVDTFPVSRYVSVADCFDNGMQRDLIPDEAYKSVAYWEQRGSSTITPGGPKGLQWNISQTLRLVVWLNFAKIGLTDYDTTDELELYAIKQLHGLHGDINTALGYKFGFRVSGFETIQREPRTIFAPYSYSDKEWAFSWPYGFFAVDFNVNVELAAGCIVAPTLGDEITCITTW